MKLVRLSRLLIGAELPIILVIAPALLFPTPRRLLVLLVVPAVWVCARIAHGSFVPRTPLNTPLWLLLATVVMSLFATVDVQFSLGKVASVALGALLFWATTRWLTTSDRLKGGTAVFLSAGAGLAVLALLGTNWLAKFPALDSLTALIPRVIRGVPGAEDGFNPNAVAGCLVLFVPLQIALLVAGSHRTALAPFRGRDLGRWLVAIQVMILVLTTGALVLMQSRGAWVALIVAAAAFLVWQGWGRRVLVATGATVVILAATLGPARTLSLAINRSGPGMASGASERIELWSRAIAAIQDVPLTGMGMNGFRRVMPVLYATVRGTDLDVAHAHNQLLQVALDVGLVGLVAYVALWLVTVGLLVSVHRHATNRVHRAMAGGLGTGLIAHFLFGMTDAIALGTKVGVLFWLTLAMTVALHRVSLTQSRD